MSTSIYRRPYFYIIQHINSGKFYAGVRYGKNSNPDQLLKFNGYQTSSDVVKKIILEEGLESFIIRKIRVFETADEALDYESRFLRRVNAAFNDNFLNRSNNSISTLNVDREKYKQTCLDRYNCESSNQSEEVKEKQRKTCLDRFGVSHASKTEEFQEKRKKTCLENYGVSHPSQVPEFQEKKKQNFLKNHGVVNPSQVPEFQEKKKQTSFKKYGVSHPSQTEEFQEKKKQTCLEKFGCTNPSLVPEIREKKRIKFSITMNRPIVLEIIKYRDKFKLKLGCGWYYKSQEILDNLLAELKLTYDLENPSQISNSKEKMRKTINDLLNQPTILEIRKYKEKLKLKLGRGWYYKPQEFLDNLLIELKMSYGELE